MAKKTASDTAASAADLRNALPPGLKVIEIPSGASVQVDVDVNEMVIPYTIAVDGKVLIKSLVDRREDVNGLTPGTHRLGWGFAHNVKNWSHKVSLRVNNKTEVLEQRSEANKDPDHSVGVAFLVVA